MKYMLFFAFVINSLDIAAQTYPVRNGDSSYYYQREMGNLRRKMYDSLMRSEEYQTLARNYRSYLSTTDRYRAFMLFAEVVSADFSKFNNNITVSGFPALEGPVIRVGMGISSKKNRKIVDFSFFAIGFGKKSKKGEEKISTFFSNLIILDIGYDLIKSRRINFYPFAGLSLRSATLNYAKPVTTNPSSTDITNLIQNNQSVFASSLNFGFQAGTGLDFVLTSGKKSNTGGTILFFKAGINKAIGKETYETEGPDYRPGIRYGDWTIATGFKFLGRN